MQSSASQFSSLERELKCKEHELLGKDVWKLLVGLLGGVWGGLFIGLVWFVFRDAVGGFGVLENRQNRMVFEVITDHLQ